MRKDNTNSNSSKQTEIFYDHPIRYKQCTKCKEWKPISEFNKDNTTKTGLRSNCRACIKKYDKQRYIRNKDKVYYISQNNFGLLDPINFGYKKCTKCNELKSFDKFNTDISKKNNLSSSCKQCHHKQQKENYIKNKTKHTIANKIYREKNKEKIKERGNIYRLKNKKTKSEYDKKYIKSDTGKLVKSNSNHKRRQKEKENPEYEKLTIEQIEKILKDQNNTCPVCGRKFTDKLKPTKDHIHPIDKGGIHVSWNIQFLCQSCNSSKSNKENLNNIQYWLHKPKE